LKHEASGVAPEVHFAAAASTGFELAPDADEVILVDMIELVGVGGAKSVLEDGAEDDGKEVLLTVVSGEAAGGGDTMIGGEEDDELDNVEEFEFAASADEVVTVNMIELVGLGRIKGILEDGAEDDGKKLLLTVVDK